MDPFYKLVKPRADVLAGATNKGVYAANLGDLIGHSNAGKQYWDRKEFNKLTYHTRGLDDALDDIRARLHEGQGSGFRQIETSFGGGKTHSMIAMYHMCRDWDATPVVIDGTDLDPATQTIWGEMERQLDGKIDKMSSQVAPGGSVIADLLKRPKPILILIDEVSHYLDGSRGVGTIDHKTASKVEVGQSNMAAQTINFLQRLFTKVGQLPHVCVVISLPDRDQAIEKESYDQVQQIAGRQKQVVTVATDDDVPHIIRRRLFETGEDVMLDRATQTIRQYVEECVKGRSIPRDEADAYEERFRSTYPFTPDVIDVLYKRWGSYQKFQRTRGALRLLSSVVHSLLKSGRPYITLSDIDLNVNDIRKELVDYAGANTESVISLDITSGQSNAERLGEVAVRAARAIFMYSFPAENKGATMDDVKRAAFTTQDNHSSVGDTLAKMQRTLFYLDLTDDSMFRFTHDENINKIIDRATHSINDTDAEERNILEEGAGRKFRKVYAWPEHHTRIEDVAGLQLVILKEANREYCKGVVANVSSKSGRVNQNALVFVLPAGDGRLADSIRKLLAVGRVRRDMGAGLKPADIRVLNDAEKEAKGGIAVGIREKYTEIWLPAKDDVIRQCRIGHRHPDEDRLPFGDVIWEKLVAEFQIAERLDPDLVTGYDGTPEDVFNRMMRTCGERRPMSLDVVRAAMEKAGVPETPEPQDDLGGTAGTGTAGGGRIVDYPPPGAGQPKQPEPEPPDAPDAPPVAGVHCTDVVDRETVAGWGAIFATLRNITTTTVRVMIDQKGADTFSVHLDMTGEIPRDVADSIKENVSENGTYSEDEGW